MRYLYFFLTLLFVSFLATGGIFVKLSELGPISTGFYRVLFSIPILYPFFKIEKRNKVICKDKLLLYISGGFLAGDLILWNISFSYTTVANANLLANLVPFSIVPACYFLYKEKISKKFLLGLFLALLGLFILITGKQNTNEGNVFGDFLAFMTSIFYALFLLIVYKVRTRVSSVQVMYYSAFGSVVVLLLASLIMEGVSYPTSWRELWPLIGLAIFSQILGQGGLSYILGKISASLASILVLMQPVISALYAYILFHENLSLQEILGIFIVIVGIFFAKNK
ncbi:MULTISPECIES: DMT family transporter [unclassified Gilliamella]|jgi:drug/metabolite transporter (DMT)-like permease|uniref:DMT family transporter n=1 Tax=unclassified Gilliamella TaxID=2685620 RepID=UPI00080ECA44|nr:MULTISPECIES: DMT family transporter [Gilliamella]MWP49548.1 EamA family transporter [Gilliamella sp. Lep-s35]MWP70052.1 EamA family transporter [Gilliamella sp. Lep-s5]MWP78298.1 EamA family transporter [Gilliamella sp. Lep-s21]OCG17623.1 transporter [Gilliamella apicola]OCG18039.1 transporter [Gilliamella apicola]